jgi:hypothetical protein
MQWPNNGEVYDSQIVHYWDLPSKDCLCLQHVAKMNQWGNHCYKCQRIISLWLVGSARIYYPMSQLFPTITYLVARIVVWKAIS